MNALHKSNYSALEQIQFILRLVSQRQLESNSEIYTVSTLGKHVRHIVDHYLALKNGLETKRVDYNLRNRDSEIETNSNCGVDSIQQLQDWMVALDDRNSDLLIESEIDCQQSISQSFSSNKNRELLYLLNHTIHHAAYIKLLLRPYNLDLPEQIGIAPCTASHLREEALVSEFD